MDKGHPVFVHARKPITLKEVVIKIDIGLTGVEHNPVTIKNYRCHSLVVHIVFPQQNFTQLSIGFVKKPD
jgi:hypothetical protein